MTVKWITRVVAIVVMVFASALTGCAPEEGGNNAANTEDAAGDAANDDAANE